VPIKLNSGTHLDSVRGCVDPSDRPNTGHFSAEKTEDPLKDRQMFGELNPCGGGDPIPLQKPRLVVGRQPSCDIILRFPNVSSRHCEVQLLNGYWHVRDLGSRNGIKVNGIRCESHWLMPGDVLSVAKHRYEVNYSPEAEAPPPVEAVPDPLSMSLLEKAGLSHRGASSGSRVAGILSDGIRICSPCRRSRCKESAIAAVSRLSAVSPKSTRTLE